MSKGTEAGEQRISLGIKTGLLDLLEYKKHEKVQWDKDLKLQQKESCISTEKLNTIHHLVYNSHAS